MRRKSFRSNLPFKSMAYLLPLLVIFVAAPMFHVSAATWSGAYSEDWDGTGGLLDSQDNWGGILWIRNMPNSAGATATFANGATRYTVNVNGTYTVGTLEFTSSSNYTLNNGTLLLRASSGNAVIQTTSSGNTTINSALVLSNGLNITNSGTGVLTLAGMISQTNASGITKAGSGTTILSGSNSYTGTTTINNGVLIAANNKALGATNNGTTVVTNAALYLSNSVTISDEALTLAGTGISNTGALRSISGTNAFTGLITATNTTTSIGAATNTVLVVSNINSGSQQLWVAGEGTTVIAGGVTNSGSGTNFIKTNSGTAILAGSNSWNGSKYIQGGTVVMSNNNAFGTNGTVYLGAAGTNQPNATLQIGTGITNSRPLSVIGTGANDGARTLSYQGSGTATQLGGITLNSNSLFVNVATNGTLNFGSTITVNTDANTDTRTIFGGGGTIIVTNNGTAPSTNRYQVRIGDATVILGEGALSTRTNIGGVGHVIDLGIGTNSSVPNATSALLLSNGVTVNNPIYVASSAGGDRILGISGAGTATFSGSIGIASSETNSRGLKVSADAGGTAVFSGPITNFSGGADNKLTKIGAGTVSITGTNNNYGGATIISNGTLRVASVANAGSASSIGTNASIVLAGSNSSAAVLDYTGGNVTINRAIVATNGGGTINMAASNTTMTLTGSASGPGTLEISKGTLVLSNTGTSNSFAPAAIKVDSGATLQLAANNQIGDSTGLILNGGTFLTGTSSTQFSDTLGTLTVTADSVIDLGSWTGGSTPRQLIFADSSAITWTGTLTITNWQGVAMTSSDVAEILFGAGGLTSAQLSQVVFASQGINGGALIGGGGELVPIPEPKVYAAAVALLAAIGWRERRRLRGFFRCRATGKPQAFSEIAKNNEIKMP